MRANVVLETARTFGQVVLIEDDREYLIRHVAGAKDSPAHYMIRELVPSLDSSPGVMIFSPEELRRLFSW